MSRFDAWGEDLAAALAEPFAPESHKTKTQGGSAITFVSVHEYTERLNATVGPHGWSNSVRLEEHGGKLVAVTSLTVLGVTKENVGDEDEGKDSFGTACTNAYAQSFKRACANFGLGAYLYDEAKRNAAKRGGGSVGSTTTAGPRAVPNEPEKKCPQCNGRMWDNREGKKNPKAPDFKCRDRACEGVIWPPKDGEDEGLTEAQQMDRHADAIRLMINDMKGLDADVAAQAELYANSVIDHPRVTLESLRTLEGKMKERLDALTTAGAA